MSQLQCILQSEVFQLLFFQIQKKFQWLKWPCSLFIKYIRTIDENAKEEYKPTNEQLNKVNLSDKEAKNITFYKGKPTTDNHQTGYKGRTAIHEILEVNSDMRQLIYDNASQIKIKDTSIKNGMTPLRDAGIEKIKTGEYKIKERLGSRTGLCRSHVVYVATR